MTTKKYVRLYGDRYQKLAPLIKAGLDYVDEGCFAEVLGVKGSKWVVKCGTTDDPYLEFAKAVLRMRKPNPFFPKIKKLIELDDNYFVVLERLKPLKEKTRNAISDAWCSPEAAEMAHKSLMKNSNQKEFDRAMQFLDKFMDNHQYMSYDLHCNNMMVRGKNQLVLTDPVC